MFVQIYRCVIDLELVKTAKFNLAKGNTYLPLNEESCIFWGGMSCELLRTLPIDIGSRHHGH